MNKKRGILNKIGFGKKGKKGMESEMVAYLLIGALVLVTVAVGYLFLKGRGIGAVEYIKNIFRLRS